MQIKSYSLIENLQPQCAAYLAVTAGGRMRAPAAGDSLLAVDVGTTLEAEQDIADILKSSLFAESAGMVCQRLGSRLEFSANNVRDLKAVVAVLAGQAKTDLPAEKTGSVEDVLLLQDISVDYAAMINRSRVGMLVIPGDTLLMIDWNPPGRVAQFANHIETAYPGIELVDFDERTGRLCIKGDKGLLKEIQENTRGRI